MYGYLMIILTGHRPAHCMLIYLLARGAWLGLLHLLPASQFAQPSVFLIHGVLAGQSALHPAACLLPK